jgi:putative MFS transporter
MAVLVGAAAMVTGPANTLLFVYAENVLGVSVRFTSVLVLAAGPVGLAALLVGRALADRWGRRPTAAMGLVGMATGAALTFGGSPVALAVGYLTAMAAGSLFATPSLALANELFPTSVRATVSGWLAVVGVLGATVGLATTGVVADATGSFAVAIWVVAVPAAMAALALLGIPETRGSELEMSAPESLLGPGSL